MIWSDVPVFVNVVPVNAGRLIAALALAVSGVALAQAPAVSGVALAPAPALSCPDASTASHAKGATDVFTATVNSVTADPKPNGQRGSIITYDVEVERVYKGKVDSVETQVRSSDSARGGLGRLPTARSYVFFARSVSGELRADGCGGTAFAKAPLVRQVERLLGSGHQPVPAEPEAAVFTPMNDAEPTSLSRLAAPGLALTLAGLLGLVVVRRLGRHS